MDAEWSQLTQGDLSDSEKDWQVHIRQLPVESELAAAHGSATYLPCNRKVTPESIYISQYFFTPANGDRSDKAPYEHGTLKKTPRATPFGACRPTQAGKITAIVLFHVSQAFRVPSEPRPINGTSLSAGWIGAGYALTRSLHTHGPRYLSIGLIIFSWLKLWAILF